MKDRFTREKAAWRPLMEQTRQSGLITGTVFCEEKWQRDSMNKTDENNYNCGQKKLSINISKIGIKFN